MDEKEFTSADVKTSRLLDLAVVVFFLTTAAISIFLFRQDLMRVIGERDEEAVGIIIIRHNVIQRRYADRVIWERLIVDSPVYSGDLIRAAELSDATIHLNENEINLNENTLIRIQQFNDGLGSFHVELREGNLSVTTNAGTGIILNIMGKQVQASPGTVLSAELGDEGLVVQVSEGTAVFVEEGQSRELSEGMMVIQDATGADLKVAAAVVTRPQPNARYLKTGAEGVPVNFIWRRINLDASDTLRFEIASDKNFSRDFSSLDGLDSSVQVNLNAGSWYWRLFYQDAVLSMGELTVADANGPELVSPAAGSVFRYGKDLPQIRFQWADKPGASRYILDVSDKPDFLQPRISRQLVSASFVQSELDQGLWYWRVRPVFPSIYEGADLETNHSAVSYFKIERTTDPQAQAFEIARDLPVALPQSSVQQQKQSAGRRYIVQSGDTLSRIAGREYGDATQWGRISEANEIKNPDLIFIDQELYIP